MKMFIYTVSQKNIPDIFNCNLKTNYQILMSGIFVLKYQNLITGFQVTVENVGDVFLAHSVCVKR